jgi:tetratricopeptide (TPR) repeat protein
MTNPDYFFRGLCRAFSLQGWVVLILLSWLTACTTIEPQSPEIQPVGLSKATQPNLYIHERDLQFPAIQGLNEELTFGLLSAEIAGQRNQLDYALNTYMKLAMTTQNPGIAERATWIAQFAQQPQATLDAAIIWANTAPNNPDAQRTAAGLLLQNEQYLEAFEHLLRYEQLGGESNYSLLAGHLAESANPVVTELYQLMLAESEQREKSSTDLQTALALLSEEAGEIERAQMHLSQALDLEPDNVRALQLQARIYRRQGKIQAARELLEQALDNQPDEVRLWLELARIQLQNQQLKAAEKTFDRIINLQPDNPQIRLALARIQLETQQYQAAQKSLLQLTDDELLADQAYLHLAELAEREGDWQQALDYYAQVKAGQPLLDAVRASVKLLVSNDQLSAALQLLDEKRQSNPELTTPLTLLGEQLYRQQQDFTGALNWIDQGRALLPDDQESLRLLYTRALIQYELNQLDAMEEDLRLLLELDPNNAMALNALGYALVNRTDDRTNEGLLLIKKAHALNSESPEILDSLGWALFRLNRPEEARDYLEEAFQRLPDEEIAAHLAEVLWELGEQKEAQLLIKQMLQQEEPSPTLEQLLERRPELKPQP